MNTITHMWPKFDVGGEGSRGGKVIGRTSGGKPIYMNANHPGHKDFNAKEHIEAQGTHSQIAAMKPNNKGIIEHTGGTSAHHMSQSSKHFELAQKVKK